MNDFYSRYSINGDSPLKESFDVYLHDKHAALDRIAMLGPCESRDMLRSLYLAAPHAVAKTPCCDPSDNAGPFSEGPALSMPGA